MAEEKVVDVIVRPKRQVTIPRRICEQLGIGPGDMLELAMEGSALLVSPKKQPHWKHSVRYGRLSNALGLPKKNS